MLMLCKNSSWLKPYQGRPSNDPSSISIGETVVPNCLIKFQAGYTYRASLLILFNLWLSNLFWCSLDFYSTTLRLLTLKCSRNSSPTVQAVFSVLSRRLILTELYLSIIHYCSKVDLKLMVASASHRLYIG